MPNVFAIDIGGTHFRTAIFNQEGEQLELSMGATLRSGGREWMLREIRARFDEFRSSPPPAACGVSFGGPVDYKRQRVTSVHTPGWENFPLAEWIENALRVPCRVDNDANAGALGEFRFGAGRGAESIVYITHSTGIGSGIIVNGELYRGKDGMAGEVGHLPLRESAEECTCGLKTGCTEALASGRALDRKARELARTRPEQSVRLLSLCGGDPEKASARELIQAATEGEAAAAGIFSEAAGNLALGLLMVIRLLDPDKIILGGGVTEAGDFLLQSLRDALKRWWSDHFPYTTEIVLAGLGSESPLYGAAALGLGLLEAGED
ncbi:MAG: ROK family protein [Terriglobia bacterium]